MGTKLHSLKVPAVLSQASAHRGGTQHRGPLQKGAQDPEKDDQARSTPLGYKNQSAASSNADTCKKHQYQDEGDKTPGTTSTNGIVPPA